MFGLSKLELNLAIAGALLLSFCVWLYVHDHKIIAAHDAKLVATGATLKAQAEQRIIDLTAQHTAEVEANQVKLDEALKTNAVLSDSLDSRVHDFQAYRRSHPDVPRSASGSGPTVQGECGAQSCGDLASQSLQDSDQLARSVGELSAVLKSAQVDRDSLTGLPK